jgi:hypothetical protein
MRFGNVLKMIASITHGKIFINFIPVKIGPGFDPSGLCLRDENIFHLSNNRHNTRPGHFFGFKINESLKIN